MNFYIYSVAVSGIFKASVPSGAFPQAAQASIIRLAYGTHTLAEDNDVIIQRRSVPIRGHFEPESV